MKPSDLGEFDLFKETHVITAGSAMSSSCRKDQRKRSWSATSWHRDPQISGCQRLELEAMPGFTIFFFGQVKSWKNGYYLFSFFLKRADL